MDDKYLVYPTDSIKQTMEKINLAASKIVFVVDSEKRLLGSVSDGDIRRAILKNCSLNLPVQEIMYENTMFLDKKYQLSDVKELMLKKKIETIPVLDNDKKIIKLFFWNEIFKTKNKYHVKQIDLPVVIMAGGKGTRMVPFTNILPKPLIPIGDRSMIEIIMDEYYKFGMKNFYISINHKGKMIRAYLDEVENDYVINYINEAKPLGTAGALKFIESKIESSFFVSNCDIIIKEDYTKIYDFHRNGNYDFTIVASLLNHTIPYGVCEIKEGGELKSIIEKPQYDYLVNTGMYLLEPHVLKFIPENKFFHITDLINKIREDGYKIGVFPVSENSYIDVGQWSEYLKSLEKMT